MPSGVKLHLYTVTWCPHCCKLLEWLDQEGIAYANHDVDESDEDWRKALSLTGGQDIVPVAEVDGQAVWGAFTDEFRQRLRALLG